MKGWQVLNNMVGLSGQATAQGDIGILFAFMKINDPGSIVRPSEFATAEKAPGIPERFRNFFCKISKLSGLEKENRPAVLTNFYYH